MQSPNSNNSKDGVEVNGVLFETLVPIQTVNLPQHDQESPIQFGVRITNRSSVAHRFELEQFLPEMLDSNQQPLEGGLMGRNKSTLVEESAVPLLQPGESVEFLMNAEFRWMDGFEPHDCIGLWGRAHYGGVWGLYSFKPGEYYIRLKYSNDLTQNQVFLVSSRRTIIHDLWRGEVTTPPVRINLR